MKALCDEENICVFVANLPATLSNPELAERVKLILSPYGNIVSVKTSRDLKNRPYAFVQFEGPVYDFMLTEMVMIEDRVLRFEKAKSSFQPNNTENRSNAAGSSGGPPGYASSNTETNSDNYGAFFVHPQTYVPYYSFHHPSQQVHTFQVPHQPLPFYATMPTYQPTTTNYSKFQTPTNPESPPLSESSSGESFNKMFIGNLNGELVTQRKLLRHFQHHGHITDIELFKNNLDGSLRLDAFAFISYLKSEQVHQAIKEEDGKEWLGRRLKCCKALKKREIITNDYSPPPTDDIEAFDDSENVQICLSQS